MLFYQQFLPQQHHWWTTPVGSILNCLLRCICLPVFVVLELIELPERLVWTEPVEYNPRSLRLKPGEVFAA